MWQILSNVLNVFRGAGSNANNNNHNKNKSNSNPSIDIEYKINYAMESVPLPLPEDSIITILSFVPASDLLRNCIFIKEWEELIRGQSLWLRKCQNEGKLVPRTRPQPLPENFYRALYFVPFNQNLVKNPCGRDRLQHWDLDSSRDGYGEDNSGWEIENPPKGADPVPNSECQSCFATTYYWCKKSQTIDLAEAVGGYISVLDECKPGIEVSEWYAARFDCGSIYHLSVCLLNEEMEVLDNFEFDHTEPQWTGTRWEQVKHVFKNYPSGVRYVRFEHAGKDTQFWAGHYGSKMTNARVSLLIES